MKSPVSFALPLLFFVSLSTPAAPRDRITHGIDNTRTVRLSQNIRSEVNAQNDRGPVDGLQVISGITVALAPSSDQQAALDSLLEAQRDPSSPDYRRWLTPEEFGERFGASENDIAALSAWLREQGFGIDQVARGRGFITISGTVSQLAGAFHTNIRKLDVEGKMRWSTNVAPSIPEALAGLVTEIRGLDDFRLEPRHYKIAAIAPDYTASSTTHYLVPDDLATIYNVAGLYGSGFNGTGQKVAVVGQTDINLADIQAFRSRFNLPANPPQVILTGRDPGTRSGDLTEAELDLEWAGAVARNATILYVNSTNVFTSVQYAIDQNLAPVISMSYGGCEQQNSSSLRSVAQQANAQGITWIASSGDSGAAGCDSSSASTATHGLAVEIPASFPEVTAIGGTTFAEGAGSFWAATNNANGASALSYIPETSWNDTATRNQLSASGGGASIYYAKPAWQTGTSVPNDGARDVPDISFTASPDHDGYLIYMNGSLYVIGGTSAPAPAFAGYVGILNQYLVNSGKVAKAGLGNINPTLYHLAQSAGGIFHDVTSGSNIVPCAIGTTNCTTGSLGFSAGVGYDEVTGLGSADLYQLTTNWSAVVASVSTVSTLTANPASVTQTGTTQLTATVRPSSGKVLPTGTVTFSAGSVILGTATLSISATATLTVAASNLAVGNNTIVATYAGSTGFSGSSASTLVTVTGGPGSQVVPSVNPNPVTEAGGAWTFTLSLRETAGQATTLTNFTLNGISYASSITAFFGTNKIPANGSIAASLRLSGVTPPTTVTFGFSGVDPSGQQWTKTLPVQLLGPAATQ
jgi:subtilase family serine protease